MLRIEFLGRFYNARDEAMRRQKSRILVVGTLGGKHLTTDHHVLPQGQAMWPPNS